MYYVYILKCSNSKLYIGYSSDLRKRLKEHQGGKVFTTKRSLPVEPAYYEAYKNREDAVQRERSFKKSGSVYNGLIKRIKKSLDR